MNSGHPDTYRYDPPEEGDQVEDMEGWFYTGDEWWAMEPETKIHLWVSPPSMEQGQEPVPDSSSSQKSSSIEYVSNTWRVNDEAKLASKSLRSSCEGAMHFLLCGHRIRTASPPACGENCVFPNKDLATERAFCCPTCVTEIVTEEFLRRCAGNLNEKEYEVYKQEVLEDENLAESIYGLGEMDMLFTRLRQCEAVTDEYDVEEFRGRTLHPDQTTTGKRSITPIASSRAAWQLQGGHRNRSASPLGVDDESETVTKKKCYRRRTPQPQLRGLADSKHADRQVVNHTMVKQVDVEVLMENFGGINADELTEQLRERFQRVMIE